MNHRKLRNLRWVRRFNLHRCNHYQNVAEHSYFVALLAWSIAFFTGEDQALVLRQALMHDAPEAVTGDIPLLVRQRLQEMDLIDRIACAELGIPCRELLPEVRLADSIELKMYLEEEARSGNPMPEIEAETAKRIDDLATSMKLSENPRFCQWLPTVIRHSPLKDLPQELVHGDHD